MKPTHKTLLGLDGDDHPLYAKAADLAAHLAYGTAADTGTGTLLNIAFYKSLATMLGGTPFAAEVAVTVTTGTKALVFFKAMLANNTAGALTFLSFSVSGASTIAASDNRCIHVTSSAADDSYEVSGFDLITVTAGSNTFTLEGHVSSGTGTIAKPEIAVIPL